MKGKVVDLDSNQPLPGATVVEKGTSNGVITDFDGNFIIDVEGGKGLVVSYLGYQDSEVLATEGVIIQLAVALVFS